MCHRCARHCFVKVNAYDVAEMHKTGLWSLLFSEMVFVATKSGSNNSKCIGTFASSTDELIITIN